MDPGIIPEQLRGLTQVEEMLISRVCPIMQVYRKHGGQMGYKGHVLNLPQDIQSFLNRLPARVGDLPVMIARRHGADDTHRDFTVRRHTEKQKVSKTYTVLATLKIEVYLSRYVENVPDQLTVRK